jgi:hypothetical protein
MICGVQDQEGVPEKQKVTPPTEQKLRWWIRVSPWCWGLLAVVAIGVILATQVPRISAISSSPRSKPSPASAPGLSGLAYTQAEVAERSFADADLHGAILRHLDLRGKDFQRADAAGAIFARSLLNGVNLSRADLRGANLRDSCLRGAILTGAQLAGADFTGADVTGAAVAPAATASATGWASTPTSSACGAAA